MPFKDLKIKYSYSSERDDILNSFYVPVLKESVEYKRVGGYFSSTSFYLAARGISQFVVNGGHMQLIINVQLSSEDYEQIDKSLRTPEEIIEHMVLEDLKAIQETCVKDHVAILGWMIANGFLDIKVGYIKNPITGNDILHQKVGILKDLNENIITFSGSNNESAGGWLLNSEKFKVFCSWEPGTQEYIKQDLEDFQELWLNISPKTGVIPFPEAAKQNLISISPKNEKELNNILQAIEKQQQSKPDQKIILHEYQNEAIKSWFTNDCKGLLEMATGTGKTYTAIGALKELYKKEDRLITIISCPFLHLLPQWEKSLQDSNVILPKVLASSNDPKWKENLQEKLLDVRLKRLDKFIILTTHDTVSSENFRKIMLEVTSPILLIGDEVHGMGSTNRLNSLLPNYKYRLGLSATPTRYFDDVGTQELFEFFNKTVYSFDLHKAINKINPLTGESYLTPYEYYPIFVDLSDEEFDKYIQLSTEISRLYSRKNKSEKEESYIEYKLRQRADIIKNAESKYEAFAKLLKRLKENNRIKRTLVYCSPQQIQHIQEAIRDEKKILQHKFTSNEDAIKKQSKFGGLTEREYLLKNFDDGIYDILVAIKCLDEGVDIPSTRTAILMCSTGNPKEYIQRRGRVLRRFPGKEKAIIYDFVIIPDIGGKGIVNEYETKIIQSQFQRIEEFTKESLNSSEISRELFKIKLRYKILGVIANVK